MSRKNRNIHIPSDPPRGPSLFWAIVLLFLAPPITTVAGIYMLIKRGRYAWTRRQLRDFRQYAAIIGDRDCVSLRELATRLGKNVSEVANDLQSMIDQNIFDSRTFIDRSTMMLYLDGESDATDFIRQTVNIFTGGESRPHDPIETEFVTPEAPKPAPKPENAKPASKVQLKKDIASSEDFEDKLREIRKLNDDIDNELVSERIDRIGALTASIFRVVREKPERADEVRRFMNYYLPTTLKLLKAYSLMEKQSYQGENIQASRKKIEDVLGTLVHAFEQQQDKLFQSDVLDVDADISVLETMMASDGLTEQSRGLHL